MDLGSFLVFGFIGGGWVVYDLGVWFWGGGGIAGFGFRRRVSEGNSSARIHSSKKMLVVEDAGHGRCTMLVTFSIFDLHNVSSRKMLVTQINLLVQFG